MHGRESESPAATVVPRDGQPGPAAPGRVRAGEPVVSIRDLDDLLSMVDDALVTIGDDGLIAYASPAVRRLTGYDPHTLIGQPARSFIDPAQADEALARVPNRAPENDAGLLIRLLHADGSVREVQAYSQPSLSRDATSVPVLLRAAEERGHTLDALRHRLAFEDLLTRIAATFLHRGADEVDDSINEVLAEIGLFASVDRAYIYRVHDERSLLEATHEWVHDGVQPGHQVERLVELSRLPRWMVALRDDEAVYLPRVADLGATWQAERAYLEARGVRSTLAVAINDEDRLVGFIGVDLVASERLWSDDHLAVLSAAGGIISQALARREAEQRFGLAFDRAPLGMALHGPDGTHLQVNPAFCALLGRPADDLIGASVLDFIVEDDRDELVERHRALVAGEVDQLLMELRFRRCDGAVVWCRVHTAAVRSGDGSLRYTVSHVEDVTDLKRRDVDLRASEERYRTLVENSPVIVARFDRDLDIVYMSSAIEEITGLHPDELLGRPRNLFVSPSEGQRWRRELELVFETGEPRDGEWEVPFGDHTYWFQSRSVPELDQHGEVEFVLVVNTDITALKRSEAELAHQALHDPLTGLANRALLLDHLGRALTRRHADGIRHPVLPALLFIDIDRFKLVNDSLGHRVGDQLLVAVAERLTSIMRPEDLVARLGGDEFVVVLDAVADAAEPMRVADRIKAALGVPLEIGGHEVVTTGSVGIAMPTTESADAEGLLRDADAAMYLAKANGRNRVEIFDTALRTQATEKLQMESALRRALDVGGFEVHYQPELDLATGNVVGFEALVRWNHPTEGRIAAWAFIELAEETGIILELGEWVLREACRQAGEWRRASPDRPLTLRVNLSGRQFAQPDLVEQVVSALEAGRIDASALCLEITETALMADPAVGLRVLNDLRALGITLAIDDFGTGYSSLAYLKRFPVDVLKIDRTFVDGLGEDPDDTAIATAIISLARALGLSVVAEGVETRRQLDELRRLGCDHAQGYLFARPGAPAEVWAVPSPFDVAGTGNDADAFGDPAVGWADEPA